jgi:hypothetical protein
MHAVTSQGTLCMVTESDDLQMPRPTRHPWKPAMSRSIRMPTRICLRTCGSLPALSGGLLRRTALGEENL